MLYLMLYYHQCPLILCLHDMFRLNTFLCLKLVKYLVETCNADDEKDKSGKTALLYAAENSSKLKNLQKQRRRNKRKKDQRMN